MKTLFLFIDGLGISELNQYNPFTFSQNETLSKIIYQQHPGFFCQKVDPCLDITGLPQSGTGQMSLLTGKNAAKLIGKHHGPFPPTALRPLLKTDSIATWCDQHQYRWDVLNAYPPKYFKALEERRIRLSTFGFLQTLNGKTLHTISDLENGIGYSASLTFDPWIHFGFQPIPKQGDPTFQFLTDQFKTIDFGILEFFELDYHGHHQDMEACKKSIHHISNFLDYLFLNNNNLNLVICSDHGNSEDISTKSHTVNPVPLISNFEIPFPVSSITDTFKVFQYSLMQ